MTQTGWLCCMSLIKVCRNVTAVRLIQAVTCTLCALLLYSNLFSVLVSSAERRLVSAAGTFTGERHVHPVTVTTLDSSSKANAHLCKGAPHKAEGVCTHAGAQVGEGTCGLEGFVNFSHNPAESWITNVCLLKLMQATISSNTKEDRSQ